MDSGIVWWIWPLYLPGSDGISDGFERGFRTFDGEIVWLTHQIGGCTCTKTDLGCKHFSVTTLVATVDVLSGDGGFVVCHHLSQNDGKHFGIDTT